LAAQLGVELFLVPEIRIGPVELVPGRRFETAFAHGTVFPEFAAEERNGPFAAAEKSRRKGPLGG
jgi:hypothetical protein